MNRVPRFFRRFRFKRLQGTEEDSKRLEDQFIRDLSVSTILEVPGVYEAVREAFNNEIIDYIEEETKGHDV